MGAKGLPSRSWSLAASSSSRTCSAVLVVVPVATRIGDGAGGIGGGAEVVRHAPRAVHSEPHV
jgi:hypothetical protein